MIRRLLLAWYRARYVRKMALIAEMRERGIAPGQRLQADAYYLLCKVNRLTARTV